MSDLPTKIALGGALIAGLLMVGLCLWARAVNEREWRRYMHRSAAGSEATRDEYQHFLRSGLHAVRIRQVRR